MYLMLADMMAMMAMDMMLVDMMAMDMFGCKWGNYTKDMERQIVNNLVDILAGNNYNTVDSMALLYYKIIYYLLQKK